MLAEPRRERLRRALGEAPGTLPEGVGRVAAVSVVVLEIAPELHVLVIQRAMRAGDPWAGHMGLPGGHYEPADRDLRATAERETLEEVGIDLTRHGELLGVLPDCSPHRNRQAPLSLDPNKRRVVRPFVYWLTERPELRVNAEVAQAQWVSLEQLASGELATELRVSEYSLPAWNIGGKLVWGLTYRMLGDLLGALGLDNPARPR